MGQDHLGIPLGTILEGLRPLDEPRRMMIHALEEILRGELRYETLRDGGTPPARYCLMAIGVLGGEIYFATLDGSSGRGPRAPDVPLDRIREAVAALPAGRRASGQMRRVMASPHGTAGALIVTVTAEGAMNCAFAWNPALDRSAAAYLLKSYFTRVVRDWAGSN